MQPRTLFTHAERTRAVLRKALVAHRDELLKRLADVQSALAAMDGRDAAAAARVESAEPLPTAADVVTAAAALLVERSAVSVGEICRKLRPGYDHLANRKIVYGRVYCCMKAKSVTGGPFVGCGRGKWSKAPESAG